MLRACLLAALLTRCAQAGGLWPAPASAEYSGAALAIDASRFTLSSPNYSPIFDAALQRYSRLFFVEALPTTPVDQSTSGTLSALQIAVANASEALGLHTCENYTLVIPPGGGTATLTAETIYGAMRGLERMSQLIDYSGAPGAFVVPVVTIVDAPRFPHRGALLDSSRHYVPVSTIYAFIDAMAYSMLNVFHWHIVDDQSFPYVSARFPALSGQGAWAPNHTYTPDVVRDVIAFAKTRGIRVMVEFDTPGHASSWGGVPGLLTTCGAGIDYGVIDPVNASTYAFMNEFFTEAAALFEDDFFHLGGDEVVFDCWASNPAVQAFMAANGWGTDYSKLEAYYVQHIVDIVESLNKSYIVWQEVFDNGVKLDPGAAIVAAWKGGSTAAGLAELQKITAAGYHGILSAGWYLNYISYGIGSVQSYYAADPQAFNGTAAQKALVLGGEFALWGEFIDAANVVSRGFPFGGAVAERLWSPSHYTDFNAALPRLHAYECRLAARGLPAQPLGPSYCPSEYVPVYVPPY